MNEKKKQDAAPKRGVDSKIAVAVPPLLRDVGKLAAGVAAVSTASATGNPRNKCALQPGHSLMDWIRLGASGVDLTGVGTNAGRLMVTMSELSQHNRREDAWLAIRGKVYNVTRYLPFHPGGQEELMKGVGTDATTLFDKVHPWVNYDSILQKCYLGHLVSATANLDVEGIFFGTEKPQNKIINSLKSNSPKFQPKTIIRVKSSDSEQKVSPLEPTTTTTNIPRFDWIQKIDHIHIIFYTGPFSNTYIEVSPINHESSSITISLLPDDSDHLIRNELTFQREVKWPCRVKSVLETGKVELQVAKASSAIWETYGTLKQSTRERGSHGEWRFRVQLVEKIKVSHDTWLMEWERLDGSKMVFPVGMHVKVYANVVEGEEEGFRSYTPVPKSLFTKYSPQQYSTDTVCLMVKCYQLGFMSGLLCSKQKGDVVDISSPLGSFRLRNLEHRETFLIFAAGTGITPMLGLILFLLERRIRKCQSITLLFFNKTEDDILFREHFETLQKENTRFRVRHVLSQPDESWAGLSGHVTPELVDESIRSHVAETAYVKSDIFFTVCGPTPFTELCDNLLRAAGVAGDQVHVFLG